MRALFYDTETQNLPLFSEPSSNPLQPHLVQLAATLVDIETRRELASIDVTIRPDGWVIGDDAIAIHGITNEEAAAIGIDESVAVATFYQLWLAADARIAHVEHFDARIVRIALLRHLTATQADHWKAGTAECTARLARAVMGGKQPTMTEALRHFTGRPLENAHTARADAAACRDVYFAIRDGVTAPVALCA